MILTVLAVLFIVFCRGRMNMTYQEDRIIQRLNDYPGQHGISGRAEGIQHQSS
jgi:hypothetical protein